MNGNVAYEFGALLGHMSKQAADTCPQCGKADCKCPAAYGKKKAKKNPFAEKAARAPLASMNAFGAAVKQASTMQKDAIGMAGTAGLLGLGGLALPGIARGIGGAAKNVGHWLSGTKPGAQGATGPDGKPGVPGQGGKKIWTPEEQKMFSRYGLDPAAMRGQMGASNALFGGAQMQNMLHNRMVNQARSAYAL